MSEEQQPTQIVVVQQESSSFSLTKNCLGCVIVMVAMAVVIPMAMVFLGNLAHYEGIGAIVMFVLVTLLLVMWAAWPKLKPWIDERTKR